MKRHKHLKNLDKFVYIDDTNLYEGLFASNTII